VYPIDVHVLTHEGTHPSDLSRCLQSLASEPCNVFVIDNAGAPVGAGRARGYAAGAGEFVSYVDSDDHVLPGTYGKVIQAMQDHAAVCTLERVVTVDSGYVAPTPRRNHAVVGFRRADITPLIPRMIGAPWCVDLLVRETLSPVQLDWIGVVAYVRPGTARRRVTADQYLTEKRLWHTQTVQQRPEFTIP